MGNEYFSGNWIFYPWIHFNLKLIIIFEFKQSRNMYFIKVHIFWEAHKILRNLHCRFDPRLSLNLMRLWFRKNFVAFLKNLNFRALLKEKANTSFHRTSKSGRSDFSYASFYGQKTYTNALGSKKDYYLFKKFLSS